MQVLRSGKRPPRREELFAMLVDDESTPRFVRITDSVGRPFEYRKAGAVCGMRVSPDVVSFALTRLTKTTTKKLVGAPVELPRAVLARVERHATKVAAQPSELVLQALVPVTEPADADDAAAPVAADDLADLFADTAPAGDDTSATTAKRPTLDNRTWRLQWSADDAGIVDIEAADAGAPVEMPRGALKATVFFHAPAVGRTVGVSFTGHLAGVPGQPETAERIAAQILHLMTRMPEFRMLAGIADVRIPAKPAGVAGPRTWTPPAPADVSVSMPVALFADTASQTPVAAGRVTVTMDLQSAPERLLYHLVPDERLAEHFAAYAPMVTTYVTGQVETKLGPVIANQARLDIVLGELADGMVAELRDALAVVAGGACFTVGAAAPMPAPLAATL